MHIYTDGPKDTAPDVVLLKTFDEMSLVPVLDELTVAKVHEKILYEKEEAEKQAQDTLRRRREAQQGTTISPSSDDNKESAEVV